MTIREILEAQSHFFAEGGTRPVAVRRQYLRKLLEEICSREKDICRALHEDLHKTEFESRSTEIGLIKNELSTMIRKLGSYTRPRRVKVAAINLPASGMLYPEPFGKVLIFSAWNYPFQLMVSPFIGAIAAGNCTILKPAEQAAATADVIAEIVEAVFPPEYAAVCRGGHEVTRELLAEEFDYIFYTGGTAGGKLVARSAAEHFTPTTLELGGKNPCIVDDDAKIDLAAKRIVWGKFLNAGQTCCAPDYILAHRSLRDALIERMKHWITAFYGDDPRISPDFPRIISSHHCERLAGLMNGSEILCGGTVSIEERYVAPTILVPASNDAPVMGEEIFGPLLPVLTVDSPDEAVAFVAKRPKPLALYYFSNGRKHLDSVLAMTSSGGVCVNETIMHFINPDMPFGGVGASGHGAYHGKRSFDTFTHYKPVMLKSNLIDLPTRYPPNLDGKLKMLDMMGM